MNEKKPLGITILGWALIMYFVLPLTIGLFLILHAIATGAIESQNPSPVGSYDFLKASGLSPLFLNILIISGIIIFLAPLCSFIAGIGILKLKAWARKFILRVFALNIVAQLLLGLTLLMHSNNPIIKSTYLNTYTFPYLQLTLAIITIYYLNRDNIKIYFKK